MGLRGRTEDFAPERWPRARAIATPKLPQCRGGWYPPPPVGADHEARLVNKLSTGK